MNEGLYRLVFDFPFRAPGDGLLGRMGLEVFGAFKSSPILVCSVLVSAWAFVIWFGVNSLVNTGFNLLASTSPLDAAMDHQA